MDGKSSNNGEEAVSEADMNGFVISKGACCDGRMFLVWEDISVVLSNFGRGVASSKWLLSGLSGFAEPGRLMAIMGPSGSGKSSLLDALSGRLSSNLVMSGDILVNGKKRRLDYGGVAYVTQEDTLLGTLTVKETLTYSANLRFPPTMTKQGINAMVEATIIEMGLQDCADRVIGNWHLRGISGGEKKRLSIALETLTRPSLLFLDEPTSGLDSASAFFVVQTLKRIARSGRTVIASIHQPSNEVFALFDDLFLLSGGQTVYFGEASSAEEFFEWAGYPCPSWQNPSDHFLQCINSDFDDAAKTMKSSLETCIEQQPMDNLHSMATADIKTILVEKYKTSSFRTKAKARMHEILSMKGLAEKTRNGSKATWWKQLRTLTKRSMVNMSRDIGYYWLRIAVYIILSFAVGTIFFDIGTSYMSIFGRAGCGAFISGFMTFIAIGGFPSFSEEMKVFYKERLNGHYAVTAYVLSNFISSFPFLLAISLSTVIITYYMVKFQSGFERVSYASLNLTFSISVVESCMMIVASLVPNYLMGIVAGLGVIGVNTITAGYFRPLPDLPKPIWRYPLSLVSYQSWALQGAYKNDMIGLKFEPMLSGQPKLTGEYVMKVIFGIDPVRSKWWDLSIVIANLIIYKILLVIILKLKERSMPGIQDLLSKRKLKQHTTEKVFSKKPSFSSQRHQVVHSLSSQEGLNSPLH